MEKIYRHLFECDYPVINEPLEFRQHPAWPIKASNYGSLEPLDPDQEDAFVDPIRYGRTKACLIYECWTGQGMPQRTQIKHVNLNPYDFRPDNLQPVKVKDEPRILKEKEFMLATVEQMLIREEDYAYLFGDASRAWKMLGIPKHYISAWQEVSNIYQKNLSASVETTG